MVAGGRVGRWHSLTTGHSRPPPPGGDQPRKVTVPMTPVVLTGLKKMDRFFVAVVCFFKLWLKHPQNRPDHRRNRRSQLFLRSGVGGTQPPWLHTCSLGLPVA